MPGYPNTPADNNPALPFKLTEWRPRVRVVLDERVSRGLAKIKPRERSLPDRLARVWKKNPNFQQGAHCIERGAREAQLRADVAWFRRSVRFDLVARLPLRLQKAYRAVVHQLERLLASDFWEERPYVVPSTGEVRQTTYLPEDTWSAQHTLNWCVGFLGRLQEAARGATTDRTTPRYRAATPATSSDRGRTALKEWDARSAFAALAERLARGQPELPSTT